MIKWKYRVILISVPIVAFIFGIWFVQMQQSTIVTESPLRLAFHQWPGYDIAYIAQDKGYFAKNHVNVKLIPYEELTDQTDLYTRNGTDGEFLTWADALSYSNVVIPTKVVYVIDYSNNGDVIVGNVNSIKDLRGKTVSVDGINTFSHLFVIKILQKFGVDPNDVKFIALNIHDVPQAISNGTISAGHTWEPTTSVALSKGYKILAREADVPGMITDVLIFSDKTIKERPNDVKAIVKSLSEARDFVYSNRNESLSIIQKNNGIDPQSENTGFNDIVLLNLKQNAEAMLPSNDTHSLYASGKIISDFFFDTGKINSKPNLDNIIDPEFVNNLYNDTDLK